MCAPQTRLDARSTDRTAYAVARNSLYARPVNRSRIAFVVEPKDLLAENVAFDPGDGTFYVGSTRHANILKCTADGHTSFLLAPGTTDVWMVIGIKVDARRRVLWVNTATGPHLKDSTARTNGRTALLRVELATGRITNRYTPSDSGRHFFNDLVLAPDGTVYVTDMLANAIFRLAPDSSHDPMASISRPTGAPNLPRRRQASFASTFQQAKASGLSSHISTQRDVTPLPRER